MICNMDCFNCRFSDCVNDNLTAEEYREDVLPKEIPESVKKARIRANRYARKHRNENRERSRKHYQENKEKYIAQATKWQRENRDRYNATARERYRRNAEARRQYLREWRARKKAESKVEVS